MKFKHFVGLAAVVALLSSCSAPKKVIYIEDADFIPQEQLSRVQTNLDPILSPGDLLNIRVYSSDMTAVAPFNKGQYITPEGTISQQQNYGSTGGAGEKSTEMYLVDSHGNITFPVLGDIHVAGLTRQQAQSFAVDTLIGTAELIKQSGKHPGQLKDEVCSPGGSTIAGVVSLEKNGLRNAAVQCVLDTFKRILDMGGIDEKDVV